MMPKTETKVPERILAYENDLFGGWDCGRWWLLGADDPTGGDDGVEYVTAASRDAAVREALKEAFEQAADECLQWAEVANYERAQGARFLADRIRALIPGDPA